MDNLDLNQKSLKLLIIGYSYKSLHVRESMTFWIKIFGRVDVSPWKLCIPYHFWILPDIIEDCLVKHIPVTPHSLQVPWGEQCSVSVHLFALHSPVPPVELLYWGIEAVDPVQVYLRLMVAAVYRDLVWNPFFLLMILWRSPILTRRKCGS